MNVAFVTDSQFLGSIHHGFGLCVSHLGNCRDRHNGSIEVISDTEDWCARGAVIPMPLSPIDRESPPQAGDLIFVRLDADILALYEVIPS
jgi:hypothetical protein